MGNVTSKALSCRCCRNRRGSTLPSGEVSPVLEISELGIIGPGIDNPNSPDRLDQLYANGDEISTTQSDSSYEILPFTLHEERKVSQTGHTNNNSSISHVRPLPEIPALQDNISATDCEDLPYDYADYPIEPPHNEEESSRRSSGESSRDFTSEEERRVSLTGRINNIYNFLRIYMQPLPEIPALYDTTFSTDEVTGCGQQESDFTDYRIEPPHNEEESSRRSSGESSRDFTSEDSRQQPCQCESVQLAAEYTEPASSSGGKVTTPNKETNHNYINIKHQDPNRPVPRRPRLATSQPPELQEPLPSSGESSIMQTDQTSLTNTNGNYSDSKPQVLQRRQILSSKLGQCPESPRSSEGSSITQIDGENPDYNSLEDRSYDIYKELEPAEEEIAVEEEPYDTTIGPTESAEQCLFALVLDELASSSQVKPTVNETVVLRGKYLKRIPEDGSYEAQTVKSLDLAYNRGIHVDDAITKFEFLTSLCLKDCWLTEFPTDVLCLKKLKYLDLSNSLSMVDKQMPVDSNAFSATSEVTVQREAFGIPSLPSDVDRLSELEELQISGNPRLSMLPQTMEKMQRLRKLDLSSCGFTEWPEVCGSLPVMESIKLNGNMFLASTGMQRSISMVNLKRIEVKDCGISQLCKIAKAAPKLQYLYAGRNKDLEEVPREIAKLESLVALDLSNCNIREISDDVGLMPKLTQLHLSGNPGFGYISTKLIRLQCLRKLHLSTCCFATLPGDIGEVTELEDLDVSCNPQLASLPQSIRRLTKLKNLRLKECGFSELPEYIEEISTLRFLDLSDNRLGRFPLVVLRLKKLNHLDLSNKSGQLGRNRIEQIPLQIIGSTLQILKLDNNPVLFPPMETCAQGIDAIQRYMTELIENGRIYSDTVNVVGEPGAGKSSVIQLLMGMHQGEKKVTSNHQEVDSLYIAIDDSHWVNVQHLCGKLSKQVVPVLFPIEGLTLIVYNMAKDPNGMHEKDEMVGGLEDVRKWIISTLMRCVRPRIIVVGTHADKMEKLARESLERAMKKKVDELFTSIKTECREYLTEMESHKDVAWLNHNEEVLKRLSEISNKHHDINVLAISCSEETESGRGFLINDIKKKLKKPTPKSWWCNVICEFFVHQHKENVLYLEWKEITEIFQRDAHSLKLCINNDDHKDVIRYLRDTSQVIWIEEHTFLTNYVFHKPQLITKACIAVLEHFGHQSLQTERNRHCSRSYRQRCSSDGCASEQVLHQVMKLSPDSARIVIELLKYFHVISEVANGRNGRFFVNVAALPEDAPTDLYSNASNFQPQISVRLVFLDSFMPRAFPYSSLAVILEWAHSINEKPLVWRNGCYFKVRQTTVIVTQVSGFMEITARAESEIDDMWSVLMPILRLVSHKGVEHGRGIPLIAKVQCPGCRCCGKRPYPANCQERDHTNLMCLIDPTVRDSGEKSFCTYCMKDIPRCLTSSHLPGSYTPEDQKAVAKFYADLRQTCNCSSDDPRDISKAISEAETYSPENPKGPLNEVQRTSLVKKIKAQRTLLLKELLLQDVQCVVDKFHEQELITDYEKEKVEGKVKSLERGDAVRCLLDIIENRRIECAPVFIEVLASENVKKSYLKEAITMTELPDSK